MRWFLCGRTRLCAAQTSAAAVLALCMRYRLTYRRWRTDGCTGEVSWDMASADARFLCRRCAAAGVSVRVLCRDGLPQLLVRHHRRAGLLLGTVLAVMLVVRSGQVLWDVRVSGNESMTERQVIEELARSGLYVGMPLSGLDTDRAETQILLDSERISWIAVNMVGTVAYVEIRERIPTPAQPPLQPANLVASCDGVVEGLEIYTGVPAVHYGQAVHAGELLVSGVYDSTAVGWRVTRAAGRVMARTVHEFTVEIPLRYEQKVYLDEHFSQKTLIFFQKEIKLFKNTGFLGMTCDKISNVDSYALDGGIGLPFALRTETYLPYTLRPAVRDHAQAQVLAYAELSRVLARELPQAELLRKSLSAELTDEAYILHCTVTCLEDIAAVQEFSVTALTDKHMK